MVWHVLLSYGKYRKLEEHRKNVIVTQGNSREITTLDIEHFPNFLKAMSHEAIISCNLQRNGVSSCLLQEKSPPVTLLVCKIIRLQVIQQLAYVYNSTGA